MSIAAEHAIKAPSRAGVPQHEMVMASSPALFKSSVPVCACATVLLLCRQSAAWLEAVRQWQQRQLTPAAAGACHFQHHARLEQVRAKILIIYSCAQVCHAYQEELQYTIEEKKQIAIAIVIGKPQEPTQWQLLHY
jgi:hypothetical protein